MSDHTKGRLRLEQSKSGQRFLYSDAHRDPLCGVLRATVTLTPEEGEANARRLVACWNACIGIPTEYVEAATGVGDISAFRQRTAAERDELLAALRDLRTAIHDFNGHGMPGFKDRALAYVVMAVADQVLKKHPAEAKPK